MRKTEFEITCVAEEKLGRKINVAKFEDTLNEYLQLGDYGSGVTKLFFVFLGVPIENDFHKGKIKYTASEKHLEIAMHLPYDKLVKADEVKTFELMNNLFVNAIEETNGVSISDFDFRNFSKDVIELFQQKKM